MAALRGFMVSSRTVKGNSITVQDLYRPALREGGGHPGVRVK